MRRAWRTEASQTVYRPRAIASRKPSPRHGARHSVCHWGERRRLDFGGLGVRVRQAVHGRRNQRRRAGSNRRGRGPSGHCLGIGRERQTRSGLGTECSFGHSVFGKSRRPSESEGYRHDRARGSHASGCEARANGLLQSRGVNFGDVLVRELSSRWTHRPVGLGPCHSNCHGGQSDHAQNDDALPWSSGYGSISLGWHSRRSLRRKQQRQRLWRGACQQRCESSRNQHAKFGRRRLGVDDGQGWRYDNQR